MTKKFFIPFAIVICIGLTSCGGSGGKETPASIAKKWCELDRKVDLADGEAKEAAKAAQRKFEEDMEAKYEKDEAFMNQIEAEVEKCENAN